MTRSFNQTVADRVRDDPGFRAALVEEARRLLAEGDAETARALLRDAGVPPGLVSEDGAQSEGGGG